MARVNYHQSPFYDWEQNGWYMRSHDDETNVRADMMCKSPIVITSQDFNTSLHFIENMSEVQRNIFSISSASRNHVLGRAMSQARGGKNLSWSPPDGKKTPFPYVIEEVNMMDFTIHDFNFSGAKFHDCVIIGTNFTNCDFTRAEIVRCLLTNSYFHKCKFGNSFYGAAIEGRYTLDSCLVPSTSHEMIATLLDSWINTGGGRSCSNLSSMRALAHKVRNSPQHCWNEFFHSLRSSTKEFRKDILSAIGRSVNIPFHITPDNDWADEVIEYYVVNRMHIDDDHDYKSPEFEEPVLVDNGSTWTKIHRRRWELRNDIKPEPDPI